MIAAFQSVAIVLVAVSLLIGVPLALTLRFPGARR